MTTTSLPARYVATPCHSCGRNVVLVTAYGIDSQPHKVQLDPATQVYSRESDGEGGGVWLPILRDVILAQHKCTRREGEP